MRTLIYLTLAIAIFFTSAYGFFHKKYRSELEVITVPIKYAIDWPAKFFNRLLINLQSQQHLSDENTKLRAKELFLAAKVQKLMILEKENAHLRALLSSASQLTNKVTIASLLSVDLSPNLQQVVLNQGKSSKVFVGQPVLDAYGVLGQIIDVNSMSSRVMLITDPRSAIPVQDNRSGVRAIIGGGGGNGNLKLLYVADGSDIKEGDLLVTSGLGNRFPFGYPVGKVTHVVKEPGERFITIRVQPSAHINRSRQVLLVWPELRPITDDELISKNTKHDNSNSTEILSTPDSKKLSDDDAIDAK